MNEKPKILYVDDEAMNIKVFQLTFSKLFEVLVADSGMTGIEIFRNDPNIKFVISDMKMPVINGLEFIRQIKNINHRIPCAILSGYEQTSKISDALNNGEIVDYMMKPFKRATVEELILKHIDISNN